MSGKEQKKEIDEFLLSVLACPACKGELEYDRENSKLICHESRLIFRVEDGVPIMLIDEAVKFD
jgi:uncharacterized protein YbaR (Trm112 family)